MVRLDCVPDWTINIRKETMRKNRFFAWLASAFICSMGLQTEAFAADAPEADHGICTHDELGDRVVTTELAGVPAIVHIPDKVFGPPIFLWHGFGPPASEQALMQMFPLDDVPAIKVYVGMPLFGKRSLAGGTDELVRRQREDVGLQVFKPVVVGAADELPRVVEALERQSCMRGGDRIGLFGFSAGGAAALLSLVERKVPIGATVLLNPSTGLTASTQAYEQATGLSYAWTAESRALAKRTDAVEHVAEIAARNLPPAILIIRGAKDEVVSRTSLDQLQKALNTRYAQVHHSDQFRYVVLDDLAHNLNAGTSNDELHRHISAWFNRHLRQ
jgi:predicted esterase